MNINSIFCSQNKIAAACIVVAGIVAQDAQAMPLSWDLQVNSPVPWVEQIYVTNSEGATITVTGYRTSGPDFAIEQARVTGFGPQAGIGVCGTNEIRSISICEGSFFINRELLVDRSIFDLVLIQFDRRMTGQLSLLIGSPGSIVSRNNFWFGQGDSADILGLTFDDLNQQFDHISTGFNFSNGFGFNHPVPESGNDYDWILMSPGGLNQRFLLSAINGTEAAPVDPNDPVHVSSPATYSLFGLGAALLLLGAQLGHSREQHISDVENTIQT
ncbi:hypothetical protein [Pelagibius sp. Alg239-R121]|uniref:hypothetical protein n=1 Tax=Pelagibius sp. Alg239-R121 TaxID=2993448 RepID=UPI0024A65E2C|nr:hypothetical protein [Pelagibius sp. Alg239-R121]